MIVTAIELNNKERIYGEIGEPQKFISNNNKYIKKEITKNNFSTASKNN